MASNYTDEAVEEAVKLTDRYITDRFLPDKAIDLIDEAGSRAKLLTYALPPELKSLDQELKRVAREKEVAIGLQNFEDAVKYREEEERFRKLLDDAKQDWKKKQEKNRPVISGEDVAYVVSKITGIPLFRLEEEESEKTSAYGRLSSQANCWTRRSHFSDLPVYSPFPCWAEGCQKTHWLVYFLRSDRCWEDGIGLVR